MMGQVRPLLFMITLQDVEHDDVMIPDDMGLPSGIAGMLGYREDELKRPQGVSAGVIIAVGESVEAGIPDLKPGTKVYYRSGYALKINDVWVVDFRALLAYEEL